MATEKTIVVISRQYGSGGRDVGRILAEKLGISFFDKELIALAAEESGLSKEFLEKEGEAILTPLSYLLSYASGNSGIQEETLPVSDQGFLAQAKIIKQIVEENSCVIVGRCADYVLEDVEEYLSVFIYGDFDARVDRVMERNDITDRDAAISRVKKTDKHRANYYHHYTDRKWGLAENYDLSISTSSLGIEGAVELIARAVSLNDNMRRA